MTDSAVVEVVLESQVAEGIREICPMSELPAFFGRAFGELAAFAQRSGVQFAGPPFARYFSVDPEAVDVEACFPLGSPIVGEGSVHALELPGGPAVQVMHRGPFETMTPTYEAIERWLKDHGRTASDAPREVYLTDPSMQPDPEQWETLVVQPYR